MNLRAPLTDVTPGAPGNGLAPPQLIDGFDLHEGGLVDHGSSALSALLALYPDAPVGAVRENGLFTDMPESFPVADHPVLQATSALDLILPADRGAVIAAWDRALATRASRCAVHLASDPERAVSFHAFNAQASYGVYIVMFVPSDGSEDGPIADGRDISASVPKVATVRKDERSFLLSVDQATTQILGWTAEEMEGRRSLEFIHPDDHHIAIENWMEMLASPGPGRRVRMRHKRKDGSWVWFEITNHNLLDDPDHQCVATGMVDISEEMAVHELLDGLAEAIPLGLFQINTARQVVYTNDRLHEIIETERAESIDAQLAPVTEDDRPVLAAALDSVLVSGLPADIEVQLRLPHTSVVRYCTINFRALTDGAGTITGAIGCLADVTDSTRMRDALKQRATFDDLTGCYNRASMMVALESNIASRPAETNRAVVFVDLDEFKRVNDELGHAVGDELLRIVGERLRGVVRGEDIVGRLGGDEFMVMAPGIGGPDQAMNLADRVARVLREPVALRDKSRPHQASIGVAWSSGNDISADALVALADSAMYESKRGGRGRPRLACPVV